MFFEKICENKWTCNRFYGILCVRGVVMKLLKFVVIVSLYGNCFLSLPAHALENNATDDSSTTVYTLTDEELAKAEQENLEKAKANSDVARNDEIIETWKYVGYTYTGYSPFKPCYGQLAGGHVFNAPSSGFYWRDSSDVSGSWNVSVSIGGEVFSLSLGIQPGYRSQGVTQNFEACPNSLIGSPVKLYARNKFKVNNYAIYRKNKYDPGEGYFDRYEQVATKYRSETKVDRYNAYS